MTDVQIAVAFTVCIAAAYFFVEYGITGNLTMAGPPKKQPPPYKPPPPPAPPKPVAMGQLLPQAPPVMASGYFTTDAPVIHGTKPAPAAWPGAGYWWIRESRCGHRPWRQGVGSEADWDRAELGDWMIVRLEATQFNDRGLSTTIDAFGSDEGMSWETDYSVVVEVAARIPEPGQEPPGEREISLTEVPKQ